MSVAETDFDEVVILNLYIFYRYLIFSFVLAPFVITQHNHGDKKDIIFMFSKLGEQCIQNKTPLPITFRPKITQCEAIAHNGNKI